MWGQRKPLRPEEGKEELLAGNWGRSDPGIGHSTFKGFFKVLLYLRNSREVGGTGTQRGGGDEVGEVAGLA